MDLYLAFSARLLAELQEGETQEVHPVLLGKGASHAEGGLGSLRISHMVCCRKPPAHGTLHHKPVTHTMYFAHSSASLQGSLTTDYVSLCMPATSSIQLQSLCAAMVRCAGCSFRWHILRC